MLAQRRTTLDPAATGARDVPLLLLALTAATTSIAPLRLHWAGWIRMPYTVSFLALPGLVFLAAFTAWARRAGRTLLFNRLVTGTVGATFGLITYDGIRWLVQVTLPIGFDAFAAMPSFGTLMTGRPRDDLLAIAAGWTYHVTNGLTFGIIYALVAGPARWWWGLVWGFVLELAMMVVYPALFNPRPLHAFVIVSVIGHAAFGATVGVWCERRAEAVR